MTYLISPQFWLERGVSSSEFVAARETYRTKVVCIQEKPLPIEVIGERRPARDEGYRGVPDYSALE